MFQSERERPGSKWREVGFHSAPAYVGLALDAFRADAFKARGFWHLRTHRPTAAGVHNLVARKLCHSCMSMAQARKLTDEFSEGKTRANSIAYLIAFTMRFEALFRLSRYR